MGSSNINDQLLSGCDYLQGVMTNDSIGNGNDYAEFHYRSGFSPRGIASDYPTLSPRGLLNKFN
jgi:hypothetical protein